MDVETSEAIERINDSLVELRTELHDGLASVRAELKDGLAGVRSEIREGISDSKRHASVLFESMQDQIRVLADGVATLTARHDKPEKKRR